MSNVCPICGHGHLGKIGQNRYFCPECCHELFLSQNRNTCYYPGENGDIRRAGSVKGVALTYQETQRKRQFA